MLFDENEMLEVCKKHGIDIVEKDGYPLYNGDEMNADFSIYDIMHDTCNIAVSEKTIYSGMMQLDMSVNFEVDEYINYSLNYLNELCFVNVNKDERCRKVESSIPDNNMISISA